MRQNSEIAKTELLSEEKQTPQATEKEQEVHEEALAVDVPPPPQADEQKEEAELAEEAKGSNGLTRALLELIPSTGALVPWEELQGALWEFDFLDIPSKGETSKKGRRLVFRLDEALLQFL